MTFQKRLQKLMRDGNLTVADLAFLLKRLDTTVRAWVDRDKMPRGTPRDLKQLEDRLRALEKLAVKGIVPVGYTRKERRHILQKV